MLGSALMRRLKVEQCEILTVGHEELDLTRQHDVERWLSDTRPDAIILAAARVGGIHANASYPATFIYDNIAIAANVIAGALRAETPRLLNLGSSCMYPRSAQQPIAEASLLTGSLEPTNEWYAVAKIASVKLVEAFRKQHGCDYITVVPTNLYGPGDNFDPDMSHVIPGLMGRLQDILERGPSVLDVWGSGTPRREFMYVDDAADAIVFLLQTYSDDEAINVGTGRDVSIAELVRTLSEVMGFHGDIRFDTSKPDGMPRKLLDSSRLAALGWSGGRSLRKGLEETYAWFLAHQKLTCQ
jgi:GDP-L-fucose synthase